MIIKIQSSCYPTFLFVILASSHISEGFCLRVHGGLFRITYQYAENRVIDMVIFNGVFIDNGLRCYDLKIVACYIAQKLRSYTICTAALISVPPKQDRVR